MSEQDTLQGAGVEALLGERFTVTFAGLSSWKDTEGYWLAVVNDREQGRMLVGKDFEGTGPTIADAIRAAVAAAEGNADGE